MSMFQKVELYSYSYYTTFVHGMKASLLQTMHTRLASNPVHQRAHYDYTILTIQIEYH